MDKKDSNEKKAKTFDTKPNFDKMTDGEIIEAGYCPVCHARLQHRGGCQECPNGCIGFCG